MAKTSAVLPLITPPAPPPTDLLLPPDLKPSRQALNNAVQVPISAWMDPKHAHRVVTRHEMMSLLKAFLTPLQDAAASHRAALVRLSRPPWHVRLWRWLLRRPGT
jgi:hypothetical protein